MAFKQDAFNNVSSGGGSTVKIWSYKNTSDTLATIMATDYFLAMRFALNQNDIIFIIGSDGSEIIKVTSLVNATSVTVTAYDAVPAGTIDTADLADGAVTLAKLDTGITPSHVVKYAAQYTTTGGAAAEAITVAGVAATDLAFVQAVNQGTAVVTVLKAVCTLNTLTITFSGNPGNDAVINYQILRAAS